MDYLSRSASSPTGCSTSTPRTPGCDQDRLDEVGILATPLEFHTPKLPGCGDVDWQRFIAALAEAGYDGPVCIEVEDRDYEGSLERRQEALRKSFAVLRPLVAE